MRPHRYFPFQRQPSHLHAETRIVVILAGQFREESFGAAGGFSRGDVIVRPAFACHDDRAGDSGAAYLQIKAPPEILAQHGRADFWKPLRGAIDLDNRKVRRWLSSGHAAAFLIEHVAMNAYDPFPAKDDLERAALSLCQNPHQHIAALAEAAGVRADSFSRAFKRRFGVSPRGYANYARLERAMAKLAAGAQSGAEIAASCGYFDQSHLGRALRDHLAMTPLAFARLFAR